MAALSMTNKKLKIVRMTNPDDVSGLKPFFTLPDMTTLDLLIVELSHALRTTPDSIMILLGLDKDNCVRVVLVATNPGTAYPYININQIWAHTENDPNWPKPFIARAIMWAVALNKTYMRAETTRDVGTMYHRFGFEHWLSIVKYDFKKSGQYDLLTQHPEELFHGRSTRS